MILKWDGVVDFLLAKISFCGNSTDRYWTYANSLQRLTYMSKSQRKLG